MSSGRATPILRAVAATGAGVATMFAVIAAAGALLGTVGVALGFSTWLASRDARGTELALTTWGGLIAIVAAAVAGWVCGQLAADIGPRRGAALGALVVAGAVLGVLAVAWMALAPAAAFRSVAVELGIIGVPDRAAEAAIQPGLAHRVPHWRFIAAVDRAAIYATTVLVLLLVAGSLGGWAGAQGRSRRDRHAGIDGPTSRQPEMTANRASDRAGHRPMRTTT